MIESIVKPQPLDNDIAVIKILQLMGQLSPKDIAYITNIASRISQVIAEKETA
jgi:hypothetical protein